MLCLLTLVDVEAVSPETLTPWKEELLWRLYVDTYNHLTLGYGDERIEHDQSGLRDAARRPSRRRRRKPRSPGSSKGCRAATCSSSRTTRSTATCGCRATSSRTTSTPRSSARASAWELTVVTLDKPFLFSNICGVLSSFGMDILRGHAMTNPERPGARRLPVHRRGAVPRAERDGARDSCSTCSAASSPGASTSPRACAPASRASCTAAAPACSRRSIHADNHSSRRYTILDIVAEQRARAAAPHQPRHLAARLRRRPRADRHRGRRRRSTCFTSPRRAPS